MEREERDWVEVATLGSWNVTDFGTFTPAADEEVATPAGGWFSDAAGGWLRDRAAVVVGGARLEEVVVTGVATGDCFSAGGGGL